MQTVHPLAYPIPPAPRAGDAPGGAGTALYECEPVIPVIAARLGSWHIAVGREALDASALTARYEAAAAGWDAVLRRSAMPRAYAALLGDAFTGWEGPISALDCGIGTGALSVALADAAPGLVGIEGIDICDAMLRRSEEALGRRGVPVRTRRADLRSLPFPASNFDITMAAHVIEHLPHPRGALTEMIRVTRAGGRVVICATRSSACGALIQLSWRTHRIAPGLLARWMREAGLRDVRELRSGSRRFGALSSAWVGTVPADRRPLPLALSGAPSGCSIDPKVFREPQSAR